MKSLNLFLVALFFPTLALAQSSTYLFGKIDNHQNRNVTMQIIAFDTSIMQEKKIYVKSEVDEDGRFYIRTNEINKENTKCVFSVSWKNTNLLLSPGDSIHLSADFWSFDRTLNYTGQGAGKNNFRMDLLLKFEDDGYKRRLFYISKPSEFHSKCESFYNGKLELLDMYLNQSEIDSAFYLFEQQMLHCEYFNDVHKYFSKNRNRYFEQKHLDFINNTISDIGPLESEYLKYKAYRTFIKNYANLVLIVSQSDDDAKAGINSKINYYDQEFNGLLSRFYQYELVKDYLNNSKNRAEESVLLKYFSNTFKDPIIVKLLEKYQQEINSSGLKISKDFLFLIRVILIIVFVLSLGIYIVSRIIKKYSPKRRKVNLALWIISLVYIVTGLIVFIYLGENWHSSGGLSLFFTLVILSTFFLHTFLLIPRLAVRKHYLAYTISALALLGLNIWFFLAVNQNDMVNSLRDAIQIQLVITLLLAFSWLCYYIHYLSARRLPFAHLFNAKLIKKEILFIVLLLLFVNTVFAINASSRIKLAEALFFYFSISILLVQTFYLVPQYLYKKKITGFVIANLILLVACVLLFTISNAIQSVFTLKEIGVHYSAADIISIKYSVDIQQLCKY